MTNQVGALAPVRGDSIPAFLPTVMSQGDAEGCLAQQREEWEVLEVRQVMPQVARQLIRPSPSTRNARQRTLWSGRH